MTRGRYAVVSWTLAILFCAAFYYVAIFGSVALKLNSALLLGVGMLLVLAWSRRPEDLGHVSEGTRRRYDEPGLRVVAGRRER